MKDGLPRIHYFSDAGDKPTKTEKIPSLSIAIIHNDETASAG